MATATRRTRTDEVADALRVLDDASKAMESWQAHIAHLDTCSPEDHEGVQWQVRRSARIVSALIEEAAEYARLARIYAPLKSVS